MGPNIKDVFLTENDGYGKKGNFSKKDFFEGKKKVLIIITSIILVVLLGTFIYLIHLIIKENNGISHEMTEINDRIMNIKDIQQQQFIRHIETNQFLLSTIDWSSRRIRCTLFMRDEIVREWKRIGIKLSIDEAYLIAETNLKECESYSYIDPFLILAMQCVESGFTKKAKSPMGALGLNQIMPSTGRLLASYYKLSYSDSLLYDIRTSIRLSVKLFDILYAQYKDWELVLADYNGGPWQAYYYTKNKSKLSPETKKYVPNVLAKKKQYDNLFLKYRLEDKIEKK